MSDPRYSYSYPPPPNTPPQQGYNYYQGSVLDFRPHYAPPLCPQYPQQACPQYPRPQYPQQASPHLHTHGPCVGCAQYFLPGNTPPPNNKKTRKRDKILPLVALLAGPAVVQMVEGAIDMVNTSYSDLDYDPY